MNVTALWECGPNYSNFDPFQVKKVREKLNTIIESRKRSVEILKQHGAKTMK